MQSDRGPNRHGGFLRHLLLCQETVEKPSKITIFSIRARQRVANGRRIVAMFAINGIPLVTAAANHSSATCCSGAASPTSTLSTRSGIDGEDLRYSPLIERKARLRSVVPQRRERLLYCDHVEGDGEGLFRKAYEHDLEGIVAKR